MKKRKKKDVNETAFSIVAQATAVKKERNYASVAATYSPGLRNSTPSKPATKKKKPKKTPKSVNKNGKKPAKTKVSRKNKR